MKIIQTYRADNGELTSDPMRAKAFDIAHSFDKLASARAIGTSGTGKSNVSFGAALEMLENVDILMKHLEEWRDIVTGKGPVIR